MGYYKEFYLDTILTMNPAGEFIFLHILKDFFKTEKMK